MAISIERRLKILEEYAKRSTAIDLIADFKTFNLTINPEAEDKIKYTPHPTIVEFHRSNVKNRLIVGPYGSGKSSGCCMEILFRSVTQTADIKGRRRSKWAIIRNTCSELQTTSLQTWLKWMDSLGKCERHVDPVLTYDYEFNFNGSTVKLSILFFALDRPGDAKKLKSLELTGAWLNEACEINDLIFDHLQYRVGRYPSRDEVPEYWSGIILDTNPPDTSHWLYYLFEEKNLRNFEVYHQPPGLFEVNGKYITNEKAENIQYLEKDYYLDKAEGKSKEFVRVYCMGEYGIVVSGQRVYPQYNDDIHCVDDIHIDVNAPILFAWDYGTISPACLALQYVDDQLRCIKEFTCKQLTVTQLYETYVRPFLATYCEKLTLEIMLGDPANTYNGREQLTELGLNVAPAKTNHIAPRINAVGNLLGQLVQGQPRLLVSKAGCPMLRKGFLGEYHYRRLQVVGTERYKEEPNKTHPYSDIHDCLQYGALFYSDPNYVSADYEGEYDYAMINFNDETKDKVTGY